MYFTRITQIDLAGKAAEILPYATYIKVQAWLKEFTIRGNLKCVITDDAKEGIEVMAAQLLTNYVPSTAGGNSSARLLRFRVDQEQIQGSGLFWGDAGSAGGATWYYVDEKALTT